MDRREKLLSGLDFASQVGVEVGPLDHPLVRKADGDVRYVDYADATFMREKYRDDSNVVVANIVDVDAIWGERPLTEAFGGAHLFDYAIASHVVEHVPDLIAWLNDLHAVLKPGATLRLAVPDMRFSFDVLRRETQIVDVLTANVLVARQPLPGQILDSCLYHQPVDRAALWRGEPVSNARYRPKASLSHALNAARETIREGNYIDVHCWAFSPSSFVRLLEQLCSLGLICFECVEHFETARDEDEFIVVLRASDDQDASTASWRRIAEVNGMDMPVTLLSSLQHLLLISNTAYGLQEALARKHAASLSRLEAELVSLKGELKNDLGELKSDLVTLERRAAPLVWLLRRWLAPLLRRGRS